MTLPVRLEVPEREALWWQWLEVVTGFEKDIVDVLNINFDGNGVVGRWRRLEVPAMDAPAYWRAIHNSLARYHGGTFP